MIEIKMNDGIRTFKIHGPEELLALEMSTMVESLVKNEPGLFIEALVDNIELLERRCNLDKNNTDNRV